MVFAQTGAEKGSRGRGREIFVVFLGAIDKEKGNRRRRGRHDAKECPLACFLSKGISRESKRVSFDSLKMWGGGEKAVELNYAEWR